MKILKRMRLNEQEIAELRESLDDYIWIAIDCRRGIISAGDEYIEELRDVLLMRRGRPEDIYCFGFDMATGEINYLRRTNRRNPLVGNDGEVHELYKDRIETLVRYFFELLPAFQAEKKLARYSRNALMASLR